MSNRDDTQLLQQAFSLHRSGRFPDAARLYRKVIKRNPREANALHSLGLIEAAAGNVDEAAGLMARSVAVQGRNLQFIQNYATVLCQLGRWGAASEACLKGLALDDGDAYLLYVAAGALLKQERLSEALAKYDALLQREPNHVAALSERGLLLAKLDRFDAALGDVARAVALGPQFAEAHLNRGAIFGQLKRSDEAIASFDAALKLNPNLVDAWQGRGNALRDLKRSEEALAAYQRALSLAPQSAELWGCCGSLLADLRRPVEALAALDKATTRDAGDAELHCSKGVVYIHLERFDDAVAAFGNAIDLRPKLAKAWQGRGHAFFEMNRLGEALDAYATVLSLEPDFAEAWLGRGNVYYNFGQFDKAADAYEKALALNPSLAEAWLGRGNVFAILRQYGAAFGSFDKAFSLKPDMPGLEGERIRCRLQLCDWSGIEVECDHLLQSVRIGKANTGPYAFLGTGAFAADQLTCARTWIAKRYPAIGQPLVVAPYQHDRIRIGYVSGDFRQHPVAQLLAGVIESHDRSRFEITGVSVGADDNSDLRQRLQRSFDRFIDASALGDDDIVRRITEAEIDILVDLSGHTLHSRTGIFARRPAPVQVNYLGYSGTMGADYIDYIVADSVLVPERHREYYQEKVVWLPHSYLPHDAASRAISERRFERRELGLPERGFVFCCFNNAYKLNPPVFASRMRILKAVEESVLWLSRNADAAIGNLREEAAAAGIDPGRLIFADRMPSLGEHLARHRLADLFLDTLPYNAHTTASDALWAGLPVLTQIGETFAGRVAASLLTAIGLPELIVETEADFERRAIELATFPERLAVIAGKLAHNRSTQPLFDTVSYTRHLEQAYIEMNRRRLDGEKPDHLLVAG